MILSKAEINDQQVLKALSDYITVAAKAKVIKQEQVGQLLGQVTLKSTGAAACLAIAIKYQYNTIINDLWAALEGSDSSA